MKKTCKEPNVTVIIPTHSGSVVETVRALRTQIYSGKIKIFVIDNANESRKESMPHSVTYIHNWKNIGLSGSLNKGIILSKTDYVITLHQDCVPFGEYWLAKLMKPFEYNDVILSSSIQQLPLYSWMRFNFWHKVFSVSELVPQSTIHERATAYKREVLIDCGLFDMDTFRTAGEDTDMFIRMKEYGKFVVSDALTLHCHAVHNDSLWKSIKTFLRCHQALGVLYGRYGVGMGLQLLYDLLRTGIFFLLFICLFINPFYSLVLLFGIMVMANINHARVLLYVFDKKLFFMPFVYTAIWFLTLFAMWNGFLTGQQTIE